MTEQNEITTTAALPPGPQGVPLLGVLPQVWGDPLQFFLDAALQYGDVVRFHMGTRPFFLVSGPDELQYVLRDNHHNYSKGYDQAKPLLGEGLVTSEGDFWFRQRRLMQPHFNRSQIPQYAPHFMQATEEMLECWEEIAEAGKPVNAAEEMMRLTQTIILRTMFSTDVEEKAGTIGAAFDRTLEFLNQVLFAPVDWVTKLPTPANLRNKRALDYLDSFVYGLIERRRASDNRPDDLLTRLLEARDPENGKGMDDTQIRDEVMTIFLAGHETTANALAWTWYLLSEHPEVEQRLHAEVDEVLQGRHPTPEDLPNLPYTDLIFQEVLRLYSPAWMFARHTVEDDELGGYHIPAGQMLMISPYVTHRLPQHWEDPERFDPERFTPERSKERHRFAYIPFGGGPRLCIGNNFATMEARLILARVAQQFRLELVSGYQVEPKPIATLQPKPGVEVYLRRRC